MKYILYPLVLEHMHVIYIPFTSRVDMERSPQKQVYEITTEHSFSW